MQGTMRRIALPIISILLVGSGPVRADDRAERKDVKVILRSLETKLNDGSRKVDTHGRFLLYRVEHVEGDSLFLIADCGTRGWVKQQDVVPYEGAIEYISGVIAREPTSVAAYRMRGLTYHLLDDEGRAISDATQAIRLDGNCAAAYIDRAIEELQRDDLRGAMEDLNKAIRLEPKAAGAFGYRATVWGEEAQRRSGLDGGIADRAVRVDGPDARVCGLADSGKAIELDPSNPWHYLERSWLWEVTGDLDKAIADATAAIDAEPSFTLGYVYRAMYRKEQKEFKRALEDANAAVRLDPHQAHVHIVRAEMHRKLAQFDLALADLDQAQRLDPDKAVIHTLRSIVLVEKRELGKAVGEVVSHPEALSKLKVSVESN